LFLLPALVAVGEAEIFPRWLDAGAGVERLEQVVGAADLLQPRTQCQGGKMGVLVGVVAQDVAVLNGVERQLRVLFEVDAVAEPDRADAARGEKVHLLAHRGGRGIVDGEEGLFYGHRLITLKPFR
jgi:hypothetical protein